MTTELQQKQLMTAQFCYEVIDKKLKVYARTGSDNALKFLAQVPFKEDLENSVRKAVEEIYKGKSMPSEMRVQAKDLWSNNIVDYIRTDSKTT